jgi:hypothetical protein
MVKVLASIVLLVGLALATPFAYGQTEDRGSAAATPPASDEKATGTPLPDPTPPSQTRANQVSEDILDLVSSRPGFGGLWVDKAALTHVAVTPAEFAAFEALLGERFKGEFVLERRSVTYRELEVRRDRVSQLMPELKAAGLDLLEWGPDETHGTVWVSLRKYTPDKAAKVRQLLGDDVIVEQAQATGGADDLLSRTDDWAPYAAGIFLYPPPAVSSYPQCTSGMPIVINGSRYLVTAGHCHDPALGGTFPQDVYNGGVKIGRANWADFSQNGVDAAIITAPAGFYLYTGPSTMVSVGSVPWNSAVGQTVCAGGAFSGEKCALPVIKVDYCSSYYPNRITCGVSTAGAPGAEAAGHGDSGGPMYVRSPYLRISGTIVAAASPPFPCTTQGPVQPGTTRTCMDYIRFQTASSILNHWNTTM